MTKIKMNKREMMVEAHKMAKQMVGDYSARLALALRTLWAALKKGAKAVRTPLTSLNATIGAAISVTSKGFSVKYENATITEIKECGAKGSIVKFVTESGAKNQMNVKPVAALNFQGVHQAFLV